MKQLRFQLVLFSLVAALLLSLGGVPVSTARAQDVTVLPVTWWGSQTRHDRTIQVIEMYEAEHPNVDITYEFASFNDYWTRLNTQAAGGQLACVMQQDYAYLAEWASRDLLLPLDEYYESGAIDVSNVPEALLAGGQVGDHYYGISLGTNSQAFILDVDAFERAGLDLPSPDWTWTEFEETALALHDALGIWAMGYGLEDVQMWKSLLLGLGEMPFVDGQLGYEDDQPIIDYYNMILRLQAAGAYATRAEQLEFTSIENSPIVTGLEAIRYQWSNQLSAVWNAAGPDRHFRLWHLPRPEGGQSENYLKPSMFFSITAQCPTPDLAADFINYFTNSLEANDVLLAERGVPISTVVREHLLPSLDPAQTEAFDFLARVEQDFSPIFPPDPPGFSDFLNNVYTPLFMEPILYGQITPEEGVVILRTEGNAVLQAAAGN